jgi:hypothetical protein
MIPERHAAHLGQAAVSNIGTAAPGFIGLS